MSFELSHSTLIHSLPLKLSQTLISIFHWIFFAQNLISRNLSLISLLQEKKEQLAGKNVHFGFTNVTRFELYVFSSNHEGHRAEGFWCTQEDDGWKFIPFSGRLELAHSRNYADPEYDGL